MKIDINKGKEWIEVSLSGRLDTNTSPQLQKDLEEYYTNEGFKMHLDFSNLEFVSSAGLRVLLLIQKKANAVKGSLVLQNVSADIMDIFEMTGFIDFLTVE